MPQISDAIWNARDSNVTQETLSSSPTRAEHPGALLGRVPAHGGLTTVAPLQGSLPPGADVSLNPEPLATPAIVQVGQTLP